MSIELPKNEELHPLFIHPDNISVDSKLMRTKEIEYNEDGSKFTVDSNMDDKLGEYNKLKQRYNNLTIKELKAVHEKNRANLLRLQENLIQTYEKTNDIKAVRYSQYNKLVDLHNIFKISQRTLHAKNKYGTYMEVSPNEESPYDNYLTIGPKEEGPLTINNIDDTPASGGNRRRSIRSRKHTKITRRHKVTRTTRVIRKRKI
jgi:hypothetical protein